MQVIRPREGLPLAGLVPPQLFGVDAELRFDSTSTNARSLLLDDTLELSGDEWELRLRFDNDNQIMAESEICFDLVFEDRVRRVRCTPGETVVGTLELTELENANELSGNFTVELANCEDAATGAPLGWPSRPLILHGSFDRLQLP